MKRFSYISIIILSLVTFLTSCKGEHVVPPFPKELANYFPYENNESFTFISEDNDTLTFIAGETYLSEDNTHKYSSSDFMFCSKQDLSTMYMDAIIDVNASSYPYCENNSLMIIAHMSTYYESDEFKDILSMNLDIDKDGINVIHYNNDFNCKPFEGNANLTIGDKAVLFEDGMADDSELKAEVEWNKGIISFNYDGKKWIAKNI